MKGLYNIIERCAGINNIIDVKRPTLSQEEHVFIAEAVNVDIDNSGGISVRCGRLSLSSISSHSLFSTNEGCFVVQDRTSDSAIYKINNDETLTGIRSGLTKGKYVSFWKDGSKIYYSNNYENGVIENNVSSPWPDQTEHFGVTTSRAFYPASVGSHIAFFDGCCWIAKDKHIFVSEFRLPGKYDLFGKRFSFGSTVRMIRPVKGGIWISDSEKVGFIAKEQDFKSMTWTNKSSKPAHEWSDTTTDIFKKINIPGICAVWSSDDGLCIGTEDGQLINYTQENINYPKGSNGSLVVTDQYLINSIW